MSERAWYGFGAVVILALLLVLVLWSILLWIGLVLLAIALLIVGWLVWGVVHRRRIQSRIDRAEAAKAEAAAEEASIRLEQQRAIAEQQRALAEQYRAQAAALWNQQHMIPHTMVGLVLPMAADRERVLTWAQPRKVVYNNTVEATALPTPAQSNAQLPQAHLWEVIEPEVGPDRFYLGAVLDELGRNVAVWVPLDGVITLVSIGPQGLGKTTLARSLALQQVMQGGDVAICDWFNDIAAELGRFFPHCYSDPEDCEGYVVGVLNPEMARRRDAWRAGQRDFPPLLWLIDEWAMLRRDCPAMAEALVNAFSFWRKLGLRTVVSSVALTTNELGVSKSAVSTLALFSGNENLARTWGLSGIKPQLDLLYRSGRGYCLITSQHLQRQADLLAVPNISSALFQAVIQRTRPDLFDRSLAAAAGIPPLPPLPMKSDLLSSPPSPPRLTLVKTPAEERKGKEVSSISRQEREAILAEWRRGTAPSYIHKVLRRASNYYYVVQQVIAEEEARLAREQGESDGTDRD
jgi:hypothetical protein